MATHSSILAWRIPWTKEPGRLQSIESQSWTRLSDLTLMHTRGLHSGWCRCACRDFSQRMASKLHCLLRIPKLVQSL